LLLPRRCSLPLFSLETGTPVRPQVSVFLYQSISKGKPGPVEPRGNIDSDLQRTAGAVASLVAVCRSGATVAALMGGRSDCSTWKKGRHGGNALDSEYVNIVVDDKGSSAVAVAATTAWLASNMVGIRHVCSYMGFVFRSFRW